MSSQTEQIRALNDQLRQDLSTGAAVITSGVAALGAEAVYRIIKTISIYDDFCHANDPHQEHDFGAFDSRGKRIFWRIDYYDRATYGTEAECCGSDDPSDQAKTYRVLTILLADEY